MCLLAEVLDWDERRVCCRADSHRDPGNPLRIGNRLPAACGIEYGAQAMAVHGALLADGGEPLGRGLLASVRAVDLYAERLDDVEGPIEVTAERLSGEGGHILYAFRVCAGERELVCGRAIVVLDGAPR
ncbi:MAG: 3-hydroxylacyl-ACP dehydratase [Burkholderiales bacterium]